MRAHDDRGAGLVSTLSGVLGFLSIMFLAVQLLVHLYATSMVTSAAHEGARLAARGGVDQTDPASVAFARARAEARVRQLLGRFGDRVTMDWSGSDTDHVVLRVQATSPRFLLGDLTAHRIDRTVHARVETLRG